MNAKHIRDKVSCSRFAYFCPLPPHVYIGSPSNCVLQPRRSSSVYVSGRYRVLSRIRWGIISWRNTLSNATRRKLCLRELAIARLYFCVLFMIRHPSTLPRFKYMLHVAARVIIIPLRNIICLIQIPFRAQALIYARNRFPKLTFVRWNSTLRLLRAMDMCTVYKYRVKWKKKKKKNRVWRK